MRVFFELDKAESAVRTPAALAPAVKALADEPAAVDLAGFTTSSGDAAHNADLLSAAPPCARRWLCWGHATHCCALKTDERQGGLPEASAPRRDPAFRTERTRSAVSLRRRRGTR